jgi:hypothetical protein
VSTERRILLLAVVLMISFAAACGSHYSLRDGGWRLSPSPDVKGGTCLVVHGDGDDRVMTVCIDQPEPLIIDPDVLRPLCERGVGTVNSTVGAGNGAE